MALNVELLNKVKDAILAHPEQFDMRDWFRKTECGTTACIAGWCCAIKHGGIEQGIRSTYSASSQAHDLLNLESIDYDGAHTELFYHEEWPRDLMRRYDDATTPLEKAQVAAERIDRFIEQYS